jgi:hypothetical protein
VAAVYYDQRRAGDFYEFVRVGRSRTLFTLLDMAGRRADTRDILRVAQKTFRETAIRRFARTTPIGMSANPVKKTTGMTTKINSPM